MALSLSTLLPSDQGQPDLSATMDRTQAELLAEIANLKVRLTDKAAEIHRLRVALSDRDHAAAGPVDTDPQPAHERRLQTILDSMPGAVAYWDANLILRYGNRYLMRHWAHKQQPLVGQHMARILSEEGLARTMPHVHEVLQGRASSGEHVEGRIGLTARVSFSPDIENGVVKGFIVLAMDVTELKGARAAAEQASRAKSAFLASMSHEIRTPLNGVLGFAQLGALRFKDQDAGAQFGHILAAGQHLLGLINDVLDFSKIEAGKLKLVPVEMNLDDCIKRAIDLVREQARSKGLALQLDRRIGTPVQWRADPMRVEQILLNLLTNAVKFTDRGEVRLTVWSSASGLHAQVQDTGPGMSADVLTRLFQPFEQGDASSTRRVSGTGLGLSICKQLVEMMAGRITVHSAIGQGSRFDVMLPLPVVAPSLASHAQDSDVNWMAHGLQGLRVLVAEDHQVNQLLLEQFLFNVGAVMTCVENGRDAVDTVREAGPGAFDIMLCDIEMPVMDGYQATQEIRRLDPGLPILGLTAHAFEHARDRGLRMGMVDYITKPYVYQDLMRGMARHARRALRD